jgi:hypothetical protein
MRIILSCPFSISLAITVEISIIAMILKETTRCSEMLIIGKFKEVT